MNEDAQSGRALLALLGDEHIQKILCATSEGRMSAAELHEICDASLATIYRRIETLLEHGLLIEQAEIDPAGDHYQVYEAGFDDLDIHLEDGEFDVQLRVRDQAADRFTEVWEDIRGADQ